jgi:hypothetical protein
MKFTKPISREVEINGDTFIVSMDEAGIGFRHKGKRKTARVNWANILEIAEGEGEDSTRGKGLHDLESHPTSSTDQQSEAPEGAGGLSHTAAAGERLSDV